MKQNTREALRAYRDDTAHKEFWWGAPPALLFTALIVAGIVTAAAVITFFGLLYNGGHSMNAIIGGIICAVFLASIGASIFGSWAYQCGRNAHRIEVNHALSRIIAIRPEFYDDMDDANDKPPESAIAYMQMKCKPLPNSLPRMADGSRNPAEVHRADIDAYDAALAREAERDAIANDRR